MCYCGLCSCSVGLTISRGENSATSAITTAGLWRVSALPSADGLLPDPFAMPSHVLRGSNGCAVLGQLIGGHFL